MVPGTVPLPVQSNGLQVLCVRLPLLVRALDLVEGTAQRVGADPLLLAIISPDGDPALAVQLDQRQPLCLLQAESLPAA